MEDRPSTALWSQMGLFEGGYQSVMVEFTCHLHGSSDTVQTNVVIKDPYTREWIGAVVPQDFLDINDEQAAGEWFVRFLKGAQGYLEPF